MRTSSTAPRTTKSLGDQLRVTVIATGLSPTRRALQPPMQVVHSNVPVQRTGTDNLPVLNQPVQMPAADARLQRPDDAERLAQRPHGRGQGRCAGEQRHGRDRDPGVPAQAGGLSGESRRRRCAIALTGRRGATPSPYNSAMLAQRTLKSMTRAVGVGVHGGQKVELTLRPAPRRIGHRLSPRRPAAAGGDQGDGAQRLRHPHGDDAVGRRRSRRAEGEDGRAPALGLRRARPRQPASSTSPPRKCRSSTARRHRSSSCCRAPASRCRTRPSASCASCAPVEVREGEGARAEMGAPRAARGLHARLRDRVRPPGGQRDRPALRLRHGLGQVQARDRPRPHLRLHQGGRDDAVARPGARRQPRQRGRRRRVQGAQQRGTALRRRVRQAQDPRRDRRPACSPAIRCWPRTAPSSRGTRSTTGWCARCSRTARAWEIVTFDDETTAPAGLAELAPAW